jgi:hypothetical protein
MRGLIEKLYAPVDAASVAAFRVAFGVLMFVAVLRYFVHGWVEQFFLAPRIFFPYPGFEWIVPLPAPSMYALFAALGVLALCIAAGLFHRASALLFSVGFTYVHLIDRTNYLNHYYFVSLVSLLLFFVPAHNAWSLDGWRRAERRGATVPSWAVFLLRFQLAVVYVFGAVAKINPDWLLRAQPLKIWLGANVDLPLIGPWLELPRAALAASYAGLAFDACIVPLLLLRRTRSVAYACVLAFHLLTAALFPIGMFPWLMIGLTPIFFAPGWPRRFVAKLGAVAEPPPSPLLAKEGGRIPSPSLPRRGLGGVSDTLTPLRTAGLALLASYAALQIVLPLRHLARPGDVYWNEDGFRFSWEIMVMEKYGHASFRVTDPADGRTRLVVPADVLTPLQVRMMATQPDMIRSFARYLAAGGPRRREVRADVFVTLNGRPNRRLIDPDVDLAQPDLPAGWILPLDGPSDASPVASRLRAIAPWL